MVTLHELSQPADVERSSAAELAILRVALDLFGRRGFGATSVRQIAAEAGVTPPLIAYHFDSKEGLFVACVSVTMRGLASTIESAVGPANGLRELVVRMAEAHAEFPRQHPSAVRLMLSLAYGPDDGRPGIDVHDTWAAIMGMVGARFQAAIDSGEFEPRAGADAALLTRHLINLVHMAMFEEFKRERFGSAEDQHPTCLVASVDPVQDIHDQFFYGAGRVTGPDRALKHNATEENR